MGKFRPIDTKCWERLLKYAGYRFDRIHSSHHIWTKKGSRSIPVWGNEKQIPPIHIKTGSITLGWSAEQIESWIKENC